MVCVPRGAVEGEGESADELIASIMPRWMAIVIALVLVAGIALLLYVFPSFYGRQYPPPASIPTPTPRPAFYVASPLIARFGIEAAPVLVFGCTRRREGTWLPAEDAGQIPTGTERQDIINELCRLNSSSDFCSQHADTTVAETIYDTNSSPCAGENGETMIYAFLSPSCPSCTLERPVIEALASDYPALLQVRYICTPLSDSENASCRALVASGQFDE